jgi:hypothetical protein
MLGWKKVSELTVTKKIRLLAGVVLERPGVQMIVPALNAKVGAAAGWVITAGTNISHATLPASQTSSTLVVPISGLNVGDKVTAVAAVGQVESAGNNVTCAMSVRKLSAAAAAALTDAEIGTDNVGTLTADTLLTDANGNLKVSGLSEVMGADEQLYALFTATTAASTDIDLSHLVVTVTKMK